MKRQNSTPSPRLVSLVWLTVCLWLFATPAANAGFIGAYDLANFTLTNTNADGSATTPDGGATLVLTGGNNGSGLAGTTDFSILAIATGLVQFHYSYSSFDLPTFDQAGFLNGGVYSVQADTDGQAGDAQFFVTAGTSFGFRVSTDDNTGEPGIFTLTNFSAPAASQSVPEPGLAAAMLVAIALLAARRRQWGRSSSGGGMQI